jgi:hypothetical protein
LLTFEVREIERPAQNGLPIDQEIPGDRYGEALRNSIVHGWPGEHGLSRKQIKTKAIAGSQVSNLTVV